ncbi:Multidrug resistance protein 7 [Paragonimus heterotremus]|uniref:ABC-type xenobiotic transporter n=1 Tax=Paragonimus heterotremus TaxID=100268 RepID=A0A8J4T8L3_9TREM|nr:Multidrug resistance protein 7 [Paragonimus heterotremus]
MSLRRFCGSFSMDPWLNQSLGLCFTELYIFFPVITFYLLATILFGVIYRKNAAFETFQSTVFWFRLSMVLLIICNSAIGVALGYILPLYSDSFALNASFEVVHGSSTTLLWLIMLLHDYFHGKSINYSSRGSVVHLLISIVYFYLYVAIVWSVFRQVAEPWRPFLITFRMIHLGLVSLHLISKVPVVYTTEESRRRAARLVRSHSTAGNPNMVFVDSHFAPVTSQVETLSLVHSTHPHIREDTVSCCSKTFFCWMNPFITAGYYGELSDVFKLPSLPERLSTIKLESQLPTRFGFTENNSRVASDSSWPFIKLAFRYFGREFFFLGLIKLLLGVTSLCAPIFLNHFILSLSEEHASVWLSCLWGGLVILITFVSSVVGTNYDYLMSTFGYKIRVAICGMVYRCILSVQIASLNELGTGSLLNYLTSDADRIVNLAPSVHETWAMPLQLILAIVLLFQQLGVSSLVGVGFLLVLLPLNRLFASQIGKYSKRLMHFKDARIKLMSELLPNMIAVKLACWERLLGSKVSEARSQELRALFGQKMLDAACVLCWAACPALLASSTFATYVLLGNQLDASIVFTSLALFGMLIGPMNALPWVINGVIEATVSVRRMSRLLSILPGPFPSHVTTDKLDGLPLRPNLNSYQILNSTPVNLRDASFYWSSPERLVLSNVTLCVQRGHLVGIVGPVGSGKSSLLLAILGELKSCPLESRSVDFYSDQVASHLNSRLCYAYVGQTPWLCTGTIRHNIVFGSPLDSEWLNQVVFACALEPDLAVLPHGLDTDVGEASGSRLSGGQRARVALARAVYQKADIYLLDDPLAALDVHVGEHVIQHCLLGLLAGKTRLVTAHHAAWLMNEDSPFHADLILEMQDGQITHRFIPTHKATPPSMLISEDEKNTIDNADTLLPPSDDSLSTVDDEIVDRDDVKLLSVEVHHSENPNRTSSAQRTRGQVPNVDGDEETDLERFAFGSITSHVYRSYLRAVGYGLAIGVLISLCLMQGSRNAADWWLARWVQYSSSSSSPERFGMRNVSMTRAEPMFLSSLVRLPMVPVIFEPESWSNLTPAQNYSSTSFYLSVYGAIVGGHVVVTAFRAVLFALSGLAAAARVHQGALNTILHAQMSYFDRTPQGRILNRFSADVSTIDDMLPFVLNVLLANTVGLIGVLAIACLVLPFLFFVLLPLTFIFWSVQRVYRGAARDLKRISSVARSPVYAHLTDTLNGLTVIRGLGQELRFRKLLTDALDTQLRAELASLAASSWLSIRLQLIGTGVVTGVICLSLTGRLLGWTEAPIPSRRRREAQLLARTTTNLSLPDFLSAWPSAGRIEFRDVSLTYRRHVVGQSNVQALNAVSFIIESGQRMGVVGRTGSGKTSLVRVLLRLVDHLPGPHTNGHIATQCGFVGASGQPFSRVDHESRDRCLTDSQLYDVLIKCQLATTFTEAEAWLAREVGEGGREISSGQRQLICLARALLRQPRPRIICLDEATAAVDSRCEQIIHEILDREFQGTTVMLIAHRLSSVRHFCSRVLVMHSGRVAVQGDPAYLLADDRIRLDTGEQNDVTRDLIDL